MWKRILFSSAILFSLSHCFRTPSLEEDPAPVGFRIATSVKNENSATPWLPLIRRGLVRATFPAGIPHAVGDLSEFAQEDNRWVFTLNADSVWSDGSAITAPQVLNTLLSVLRHCTSNEGGTLLYPVHGVRDFCQGKGPLSEVGIRLLDERRLEFVLDSHQEDFPIRLAHPSLWPTPENPLLSSGPYLPLTPVVKPVWRLKRNSRFKQPHPIPEQIEIHFTQSSTEAIDLFFEGSVDWVPDLPYSLVATLGGETSLSLSQSRKFIYLKFNSTPHRVSLEKRRSLVRELDLKFIASSLGWGFKGLTAPVPWAEAPGFWGALFSSTQVGQPLPPLPTLISKKSENRLTTERTRHPLLEETLRAVGVQWLRKGYRLESVTTPKPDVSVGIVQWDPLRPELLLQPLAIRLPNKMRDLPLEERYKIVGERLREGIYKNFDWTPIVEIPNASLLRDSFRGMDMTQFEMWDFSGLAKTGS